LFAFSLICLFLAGPSFADPGDIAIFREATGTDVVTTANFDHSWDTVLRPSAAYSLDGTNTNISLDAGHHLILYNSRFDTTGGGNRSEIQSHLVLGGNDLSMGWSQGYIRRSNGQDEAFTTGGGIINVMPGETLSLQSFRTDNNGGAGVQREPDGSAIQLLKLGDDWDYLRLSLNADQGGPTTNNETTGWVGVQYDFQDELDTGSFDHTLGGSDITLKTAGHYMIFANTYGFESVERSSLLMRLTLDGTEVSGSRSSVYIRGNQNSSSEGAASIGIIIETTAANQILNVEGL
jgi:hypothetical protein